MRKVINFTLALTTVLFAVSCQQKHLDIANELSTVSFTVEVPGHAVTKTSGNEAVSNINNIVYAVYKTDAESLEDARTSIAGQTPINRVNPMAKGPTNTTVFVNNNANISVELFNDQKYIILFWAQVDQTWISGTDFDLTNVEFPSNPDANQSKYEAFCGAAFVEKVKGSRSESVVLTRPLAQINIASAHPGFPVTLQTSKVEVTGAGQCFNVATEETSGTTSVTFKTADIPTEEFSAAYPHYLARNYIFANGTVSVKYEINANLGQISTFESPISNVPVAKNFKTNIVGNLLSSEIDYSVSLTDTWETPANEILIASNEEELLEAFEVGGYVQLVKDIELTNVLHVDSGIDVYLDLNGKNIIVDQNSKADPVFQPEKGGSLIIDGDGIVEMQNPYTSLIVPYGEVVFKGGSFIRIVPPGTTSKQVGHMFIGIKSVDSIVKIYNGYFDGGYYDENAAYIEEILAGTKTLEETNDDIAKRGAAGDANKVRVALKDNVSTLLNHAGYGGFKVYGGTFVGANPAWGDEGCLLPTEPQYLRPWSYYQGEFLVGQEDNKKGLVLPAGYTVTHSIHTDGRPIYTVSYAQPESDATSPELSNE